MPRRGVRVHPAPSIEGCVPPPQNAGASRFCCVCPRGRLLGRPARKCLARAQRRPRLRSSEPVRHEPVEAHVLFGGFAGKAPVNLCRDTYHEPA